MPKLTFEEAFTKIIDVEGTKFVNHPKDPGGRTKYGITERYHPEYWEDGEPSYQDAQRFYREQWDAMRLDEIEGYAIAHELFDSATLHGPARAVMFVQTAHNVLANAMKKAGKFVPTLKEDGVLGPVTVKALNSFCEKDSNYRALYTMANYIQATRILSNGQPDFVVGWFAHRICGLLAEGWK